MSSLMEEITSIHVIGVRDGFSKWAMSILGFEG
jgi:hypothetical protein